MAKRLFSRSKKQNKNSESTVSKIPTMRLSMLILIAAIALFAVASVVWYRTYYTRPSVVLWGTLDRALSTPGVVKRVVRSSADNSTDVMSVMRFEGEQGTQLRTDIKQNTVGEDGSQVEARATAESLGIASGDFQRYASVPSVGVSPEQVEIFNKIVGKWVKTNENVSGKPGQLYIDSLLGTIPFGNLSGEQRKQLIKFGRNGTDKEDPIFSVDYSNVKKTNENGRPVYTYELNVNTNSYAMWYQQYFSDMGFSEFADDRYTAAVASALGLGDETKIYLAVDVWSRQIKSIARSEAGQEGNDGTFETVYSYGILPEFKQPAEYLTSEQFQELISGPGANDSAAPSGEGQ